MERGNGPYVDGIGRSLSVLALLVAIGGGYLLYAENQALKAELESTKGSAGTDEAAQAFNERWDQELTTALSQWKADAQKALDLAEEARGERNQLVANAVSDLEAYRTKLAGQLTALVEQRVDKPEPVPSAPRLLLAESRLRPAGEGANYVVVRNDGTAAAEIQSVVFRPRLNGQFVVTEETRDSTPDDCIVLRFSPGDNKNGGADGKHSDYEKFVFGESIPAAESANVAIEIRNSKHIDWGWEGELEIDYNGAEHLVVPNVRAIFVASEDETT